MPIRMLDLFCGAGGIARGYWRPNIDITGVDINPQPNYPYRFVQADAMTFPLDRFDVIHASPPCQAFSQSRMWNRDITEHALLWNTIARLKETNALWIVENIVAAYDPTPSFVICGASMGCALDHGANLFLARHRRFFSNVILNPPLCACASYRERGWRVATVAGNLGTAAEDLPNWNTYKPSWKDAQALMGIDWMDRKELREAIPPVYSSWIMEQWLQHKLIPRHRVNWSDPWWNYTSERIR